MSTTYTAALVGPVELCALSSLSRIDEAGGTKVSI